MGDTDHRPLAAPRLKAVEALAATLVLFLVLFASAYYLLDRASPGSFTEPLSRTDALYFTLTTFSTVGFGDIAARSETGRVMAMLQMAGGLLLVGFAARVLASAVQAGLRRKGSTTPETRADPGDAGGSGAPEGTGRCRHCGHCPHCGHPAGTDHAGDSSGPE